VFRRISGYFAVFRRISPCFAVFRRLLGVYTDPRKVTSGFRLGDVTRLGRWKSTGIPNFDEISQSTLEIKLLPVLENGRPPFWNSISVSILPNFRHRRAILHWPTKFRQIELPLAES